MIRLTKKVKLAVVGIGRISTAHIRSILQAKEKAELVAVMSRNRSRAEKAAKEYGIPSIYTEYEELLNNPEIDGVILCTPNEVHAEQAIAAAQAGKQILVEKPMAMSVEEAEKMVEAADKHHVTLMIAQCRRFFKAARAAKASLKQKQIGEVIDTTHYLGVSFDRVLTEWWNEMKHLIVELNAPHPLDTTLYLLEEAPETVYAVGGSFSDQLAGTSQATIVLTFPSGKTATVHLSFHCAPPYNERIIVGTNGTMRIKDEKDLWIADELMVTEPYGSYLDGGVNFERQMAEFCEAIIDGREPIASGREIVTLMRVLDAVKQSLDQKRVISLAEEGEGVKQ